MPLLAPAPRAARRPHPLRNALRLDPICCTWIDLAAELRSTGARHAMRSAARQAVYRARLVWRSFAHLPPAA